MIQFCEIRRFATKEDLLTIAKRFKLQWYDHVSRSSGLAKTILQVTVKGGRRQGRQRERWEDNIREGTGLEFAKSQSAVENRVKMEKTGCETICGDPTTLVVKGQMTMMKTKDLPVLIHDVLYQTLRPQGGPRGLTFTW